MFRKPPITPYGTDNPAELMEKFYQAGNNTLLSLRNYVTNPETKKLPRAWGAMSAAKMVGVSNPTFRKLIHDNEKLPGVVVIEKQLKNKHIESVSTISGKEKKSINKSLETKKKRTLKKYTLTAINYLRDKAKTRYQRPEGSKPLIIAISNLKGGVGKTATAVDLGKKLAIEGLKSVLLDFDAQGTATLLSSGLIPDLEITYEHTITNILIKSVTSIKKIILKTHFDGFDIIPANLAIQDCDLILPNPKENNSDRLGSPFLRLKSALETIKNNYDVILIDCGPNLGILTLNAIIACDGIIIPIPPSMSDYSSFITYTATLRNMFKELKSKKLEYIRILLSKHSGGNEACQMENMMREQFGGYILANHMCETVEVSKASNEIGTIYDISKPRGSREAHRRAVQHLDEVNMEIINNFKEIWLTQSIKKETTFGVKNEQ